jgi:hypothetical protein
MGGRYGPSIPTLLGRRGGRGADYWFQRWMLTRAADGLRLRDIPRAVPVTHPMFHAHARHIEKDRYK